MVKVSNTIIASRKARRKESRHSKKRVRDDVKSAVVEREPPIEPKPKKIKRPVTTNTKSKSMDETSITPNDKYAGFDAETAAAMKRDDDEIAELEEKMGLKDGSKEKARLHREYSKLEGFGDDFGDFLDGLDNIMTRKKGHYTDSEDDQSDFDDDYDEQSAEDEEIVPMKGPSGNSSDDEYSMADDSSEERDMDQNQSASEEDDDDEEAPTLQRIDHDDDSGDERESGDEDDVSSVDDPDHHSSHIYRPTEGEDIYGNKVDNSTAQTQAKKYVPPHLRNVQVDDQDRKDQLRVLQRSLNNALNRLSEDTLISVAQSVTSLYPSYATSDVNECLWTNVFNACVDRPSLMTGMIPVYVACLVGVHVQTGDTVQLGGYLMEHVVTKLWKDLKSLRMQRNDSAIQGDADVTKEICNLMLVLCYLYNYSIVHATFMYDVIRHLIEQFSELDVELLLLTLSHSGHSLRSDDPLALKEIVLMVQKRTVHDIKKGRSTSSRLEYMVSAMADLKNNKKRKQDLVFSEKTTKLRKQIGRIKSTVAQAGASRAADSCLRITLEDILNAESKGRWWKVGASWVGNQYTHHDDDDDDNGKGNDALKASDDKQSDDEDELLKLASKYRMNTDSRRSVFCIVMGSADCEDAFEKLVRMDMLKNRTERDTVRVLMECCGNEKAHNPFYSHLAARICDYQPQCKFTFQLAFWDIFKQFDDAKLRKVANLAKLLYHLVVVHGSLRLSILKVIDMSPNTMDEPTMIFLTVFFSTLFESFDDPLEIRQIFHRSFPQRKLGDTTGGTNEGEPHADAEGLKESLSVFFLKTLKSSPKNKKNSKFRTNFKVAVKVCQTNELDSMVDLEY